MKRYRVDFAVRVDLTVEDDVIDRVTEDRDDWRAPMYAMTEPQAAAMLARCCGIEGLRLSQLDGWADLPDTALRARTEVAPADYRVLPEPEGPPGRSAPR